LGVDLAIAIDKLQIIIYNFIMGIRKLNKNTNAEVLQNAKALIGRILGSGRELRDSQLDEINKSCKECKEYGGSHIIYYLGNIHHLDGDTSNRSFGNLATVCPRCRSHILWSRFMPEDIWLLKKNGLNNAQIGKMLGLSRERVRQLCQGYRAPQLYSQVDIDDLIRLAQSAERKQKAKGELKRITDKRTLRKRILATSNKMNEGKSQGGKT